MNTVVTTPLSSFHDGTITLKTDRNKLTDDDWYDVEGVVVGINGYQYYIQQGEYGLLAYNDSSNHYTYYNGISLGDHVILHTRIYKYSGIVETNSKDTAQTVSKTGYTTLPDAAEFTSVSSFMNAHQSIRASLFNVAIDSTNITKIAGFSGSSSDDQKFEVYDINSSSDKVTILIHKSVNENIKTQIVQKLQTITEDDTVEFVRGVVAYYNGNQISLSSADQIIIHSPSEDKLAAWGVNYLFIGDPSFDGQGSGLCRSSSLYKDAKTALFVLESEESGTIETLQTDSTYSAELARYLAWSRACGDDLPFDNDFTFMNSAKYSPLNIIEDDSVMTILVIIAAISTLAFTTLLVIKKKRK